MNEQDPSTTTSRRQLFRGLGAATIAIVALPGCDVRPAPAAQAKAADQPGAGAAYSPRFFSADEWAFLNAATARLVPNDALGPGALEAGAPEYIDRQMDTPWASGALWYMQGPFDADAPATLGHQSRLTPKQIYRLGIAAADDWVRKSKNASFAQLDAAAQDAALTTFETGKAEFASLPSKLFFSMLLQGVREGFFADPVHGGNKGLVGWTLIGFPGARADFMDWVERDVQYPLPPVAISGQRG